MTGRFSGRRVARSWRARAVVVTMGFVVTSGVSGAGVLAGSCRSSSNGAGSLLSLLAREDAGHQRSDLLAQERVLHWGIFQRRFERDDTFPQLGQFGWRVGAQRARARIAARKPLFQARALFCRKLFFRRAGRHFTSPGAHTTDATWPRAEPRHRSTAPAPPARAAAWASALRCF